MLSKPLRYAADVELIDHAPKIGLFKVERPEFVCWDFAQYTRILDAAAKEGDEWYAPACLAGEAGLRVGEVEGAALARGRRSRRGDHHGEPADPPGITGTPKGRTRRTVPMTSTLVAALKRPPRRARPDSFCATATARR